MLAKFLHVLAVDTFCLRSIGICSRHSFFVTGAMIFFFYTEQYFFSLNRIFFDLFNIFAFIYIHTYSKKTCTHLFFIFKNFFSVGNTKFV